jgi:hypothetical protein
MIGQMLMVSKSESVIEDFNGAQNPVPAGYCLDM